MTGYAPSSDLRSSSVGVLDVDAPDLATYGTRPLGADVPDCSAAAGPGAADEPDPVLAEVRRIVSIDGDAAYETAVGDFISSRRPQWRRIAGSLCRSNSVPREQHLDDVESIVIETVWLLLGECRDDLTQALTMRSFMALVVFRARPKVRSHLDHATAPASGMVGAQRRRRELARTRAELTAARSAAPTAAETVRLTNERLASARSDAARQGMVVSAADELALRGSVPLDEALDAGRDDPAADFVLHPGETPGLVRAILRRTAEEDPTLDAVARLWLAEVYSGPVPGRDTVCWIARTLGITRRRTEACIERIRALGAACLAGIGIADPSAPPWPAATSNSLHGRRAGALEPLPGARSAAMRQP